MADRFVGKGGDDANDGTTWATRKLTITASIDRGGGNEIAAGDRCVVGPGIYRESVSLADIAGSAGNHIVLHGDVTGELTDGEGGLVEICNSDNDYSTSARVSQIGMNLNTSYWTFNNLAFTGGEARNFTTLDAISIDGVHIFNNCYFGPIWYLEDAGLQAGSWQNVQITCNSCVFYGGRAADVKIGGFNETVTMIVNLNNCMFLTSLGWGSDIRLEDTTDTNVSSTWNISNCYFQGGYAFFRENNTQTWNVDNCIFWGVKGVLAPSSLTVTPTNSIVVSSDNNNGVTKSMLPMQWPILQEGFPTPYKFAFPLLDVASPYAFQTQSNTPADDIYHITRPSSANKQTIGPMQVFQTTKVTDLVYGTTDYSIYMPDAMRDQLVIPVSGSEITVSIRVYREAGYGGTLPSMVLKQPGQADVTITDTGSAATWNLLSHTFTPSAGEIVVELVSDNTTTTVGAAYGVYWGDFQVT